MSEGPAPSEDAEAPDPFRPPEAVLAEGSPDARFAPLSEGLLGPIALVRLALDVVSAQPVLLLAVVLVVGVPQNIILEGGLPEPESLRDLRFLLQAGQLVDLFIGSLMSLGVVYITGRVVEGQPVRGAEVVTQIGERWMPLLFTRVLGGLGVALWLLALVVPGIIYGVNWLFADVVVGLGEASGLKALGRSRDVVEGRWFRVAFTALVVQLGIYGAALAPGVVVDMVLDTELSLPWAVLQGLSFDVVAMLGAITLTLQYLNLRRTRSEQYFM
jgi:hypothetical protein